MEKRGKNGKWLGQEGEKQRGGKWEKQRGEKWEKQRGEKWGGEETEREKTLANSLRMLVLVQARSPGNFLITITTTTTIFVNI